MVCSPERVQPNKRNKVLHRFYEPLVLLYALDRIQGAHLPRQKDETLCPDHATRTELRRRFLESLAYVCDSEKGGDTMTAIFVSSVPLTYHVARNKHLPSGNLMRPFLEGLLTDLRTMTSFTIHDERKVLEKCVAFSKKRISTYWRWLQTSLKSCLGATSDQNIVRALENIHKMLAKHSTSLADLCTCCFRLIKSPQLALVKKRATESEDSGNTQSPFSSLRHYIGRLGNHLQAVKVLLAGAQRFPGLLEDFQINVVNGPDSITLPPPPRNKLTIAGIVGRMVSNDKELAKDLESRLISLDDGLGIEQLVREEYGEKNRNPRVHAELVLLRYFYRERSELQFYDNDRFIGTRGFVQPATHQKIYLNWLPPTSTLEIRDPNSETAVHERRMLNSMVKALRTTTIEQLRAQTGGERRKPQFDSITWETFPNERSTTRHDDQSLIDNLEMGGEERGGIESNSSQTGNSGVEGKALEKKPGGIDAELSSLWNEKIGLVEDSDDPDTAGGVLLHS